MSKHPPPEVIDLLDSSDTDDEVEITGSRKKRRADCSASEQPAGRTSGEYVRPLKPGVCPICFCDYAVEEGVRTSACGHNFCGDCFGYYVRTKVNDGEVTANQLTCPHVELHGGGVKCGTALSQSDVLASLLNSRELSLSRTVDTGDNLACCPTAGCEFRFEWDEENRKLECPLCGKSYCLVCRTGPWHAGERCEQFQARRKSQKSAGDEGGDGDDGFKQFASRQKLKQCPKCQFWVEKISGCDAMHCRCNLVFCYRCGGCLRGTASRGGFKECKCNGVASLLQAHEGATNHNLRHR